MGGFTPPISLPRGSCHRLPMFARISHPFWKPSKTIGFSYIFHMWISGEGYWFSTLTCKIIQKTIEKGTIFYFSPFARFCQNFTFILFSQWILMIFIFKLNLCFFDEFCSKSKMLLKPLVRSTILASSFNLMEIQTWKSCSHQWF